MSEEDSETSSISRKIYFYLIKWKTSYEEKIFTNKLLNKVLDASYEGDRNIIEEYETERAELVQEHPPSLDKKYGYFKLKRIRRKDTPIEEFDDTGELYPFNPDENRVFSEPTHFIIVDGKVVISEFNINSFKVRPYLYKVLKKGLNNLINKNENTYDELEIMDLSIIPIPAKDFKEKLKEINKVKSMTLNIAPNYGHIFSQSKLSIIKRLHIPKLVEKSHVTIKLSAGRKKETKLKLTRAFKTFRKSILNGSEFQEEFLESLVVYGLTDKDNVIRVDLVKDFLHVETMTSKLSNRRGVDTPDMFAKLEKAYAENKLYIDEFISV